MGPCDGPSLMDHGQHGNDCAMVVSGSASENLNGGVAIDEGGGIGGSGSIAMLLDDELATDHVVEGDKLPEEACGTSTGESDRADCPKKSTPLDHAGTTKGTNWC